jgi:hypothetical protein
VIRFCLLLLLQLSLFAADYDCILVGSSPFSLVEALYQHQLGKKVLIIEKDVRCGGAWQTIPICGVPHAELGCHSIPSGNDIVLKNFLEEYVGCKIVSIDTPSSPFIAGQGQNGWYFSKGCYELVSQLLKLIAKTTIQIKTSCKVDNISIETSKKMAIVETPLGFYSTNKLILTPMSSLAIKSAINLPQNLHKSKHYHLYMLIQDPTPPTFSYRGGVAQGISRMMNMTHFIGLYGTGTQLIAFQTNDEKSLLNEKIYLDALKTSRLIHQDACILKTETYIYETGHFNQNLIDQIGAYGIIEVLQTGVLPGMTKYIPKWKGALRPYREVMHEEY